MDRIAFIKLGLTLVATEGWLSGCTSADDAGSANAGRAGAGPNGADAGGGNAGAAAKGGSTAGLGSPAGAGGAAATAGAGTSGAQCTSDANLVQTSTESHDHLPLTEPITAAELNAGSPTEFALALEQNHIHTLAFTPDDFTQLRAGMMIAKRSSSTMGHTHTYRIKCV
jgi:hypothetical protein